MSNSHYAGYVNSAPCFAKPDPVQRLEADFQATLLGRMRDARVKGDHARADKVRESYDASVGRFGKLTAAGVDDIAALSEHNGQYAIRMPGAQSVAVLPDGRQVSFHEAINAGYELIDASVMAIRLGYVGGALQQTAAEIEGNLRAATKTQREMAYAAGIFNLPEAQERPKAAAMVATSYCGSWSIERAAAFLRGLPREVANVQGTAPAAKRSIGTADSGTITRRIELRAAALATRMSNGDHSVRSEHTALMYALEMVQHGANVVAALQAVEIEPEQFSY